MSMRRGRAMRKYGLILLTLVALPFSLSGCASRYGAAPRFKNANTIGLHVQMQTTPSPPVALKDVKVLVQLQSGTNHLEWTQVRVSEVMSDMSMPPLTSVLHKIRKNTYSGKVIFTMGGPWIVTVIAEKEGKSYGQQFHMDVRQ
ncbi:MAG: hypothetical protein OWQ59_02840 [Alicyclobacillaceae bacterium]|nr:hypothetical protein [Alicyclobacillaceae bacterium]